MWPQLLALHTLCKAEDDLRFCVFEHARIFEFPEHVTGKTVLGFGTLSRVRAEPRPADRYAGMNSFGCGEDGLFGVKDDRRFAFRLEMGQVRAVQVDLGFGMFIVDDDLDQPVLCSVKGKVVRDLIQTVLLRYWHSHSFWGTSLLLSPFRVLRGAFY